MHVVLCCVEEDDNTEADGKTEGTTEGDSTEENRVEFKEEVEEVGGAWWLWEYIVCLTCLLV